MNYASHVQAIKTIVSNVLIMHINLLRMKISAFPTVQKVSMKIIKIVSVKNVPKTVYNVIRHRSVKNVKNHISCWIINVKSIVLIWMLTSVYKYAKIKLKSIFRFLVAWISQILSILSFPKIFIS